jgi:hypothetical protein
MEFSSINQACQVSRISLSLIDKFLRKVAPRSSYNACKEAYADSKRDIASVKKPDDPAKSNWGAWRVVGDARGLSQLRASGGRKIKLDVIRIVNDYRTPALARRERN